MINRAAILLRYKEPAVRWINDADPVVDDPGITMDDVNLDNTVYLIRDEDGEDEETVDRWVRENYQTLFESELEGWYSDPAVHGELLVYPKSHLDSWSCKSRQER